MASRAVRRSLLAFLLAVIVAIACMLVLAIQVPSVAAVSSNSRDSKRLGIGEAFDEDEEDGDWDFMDDDAILGLPGQQIGGNSEDSKEDDELSVDSLPIELVDDNYCDCEDGSDEPNTSACSHVLLDSTTPPFSLQFSCKADDTRVALAFLGDSVCDCCDGSDEADGVCIDTCTTEWQRRLDDLRGRLDVVRRGRTLRQEYLRKAVRKVEQLKDDFERLAEAYQAGQRAFEDLQRRAQQNPELRGRLEQAYTVLRRVQYVTYVQSRVVDQSTFSDAPWKPAFVELVGQCFTYTVDEKQLKGGTPNVIPREYDMVLCPFQNVSQIEPSYPSWAKAERLTKAGVSEAGEGGVEEVPRSIGLGIWNEWLDSVGAARVQEYNHGELCADGQERRTRMQLSCGLRNRVVSVEERDLCQYEVRFETPAACEAAEEAALQDEISRVEQFPEERQKREVQSRQHERHEEL